jgi:hypothetical protein
MRGLFFTRFAIPKTRPAGAATNPKALKHLYAGKQTAARAQNRNGKNTGAAGDYQGNADQCNFYRFNGVACIFLLQKIKSLLPGKVIYFIRDHCSPLLFNQLCFFDAISKTKVLLALD